MVDPDYPGGEAQLHMQNYRYPRTCSANIHHYPSAEVRLHDIRLMIKNSITELPKQSVRYRLPVISGSELIGTGPHKLKQNLSQSKLLKNSKKRYKTCTSTNRK